MLPNSAPSLLTPYSLSHIQSSTNTHLSFPTPVAESTFLNFELWFWFLIFNFLHPPSPPSFFPFWRGKTSTISPSATIISNQYLSWAKPKESIINYDDRHLESSHFQDVTCRHSTKCACTILLSAKKIKKFISLPTKDLAILTSSFFPNFRTKRAGSCKVWRDKFFLSPGVMNKSRQCSLKSRVGHLTHQKKRWTDGTFRLHPRLACGTAAGP